MSVVVSDQPIAENDFDPRAPSTKGERWAKCMMGEKFEPMLDPSGNHCDAFLDHRWSGFHLPCTMFAFTFIS
jgi:hypothetical protein